MPLYLGADLRERWNGQEGDRTATAIPRWNQFRYSEPVAVCAGFGSFLFFLQHPQSTWLGCLCQCLWPRLWLLCSDSTSGYWWPRVSWPQNYGFAQAAGMHLKD